MSIDKIALSIAQGNKEQAEIYSYVLKSKLHSWGTIVITLLVSYLLGVLPYAIIISYSIMLLRINSGGAHSKSLSTCSIFSFIIVNILAIIAHAISTSNLLILYSSLLITILGLYLINRYAPIDSPQRPLVNPQFRTQLKERSYILFQLIMTCFFVLFTLGYQSFSVAILLGLTWQLFSMSRLGFLVLGKIDKLF